MRRKPNLPGANRPKALAKRDAYREQYGVIVLCENEAHQKKVYSNLTRRGLKCRVVVT